MARMLNTLLTLAMLGGLAYGGYWLYKNKCTVLGREFCDYKAKAKEVADDLDVVVGVGTPGAVHTYPKESADGVIVGSTTSGTGTFGKSGYQGSLDLKKGAVFSKFSRIAYW